MGVGEVDGPPKKKLKQAQLPFCMGSADKSGNKRKLNSESPESGLALKVSRREGTPKVLAFNKENLKVNNIEKLTDVVDVLSDGEEEGVLKPNDDGIVEESVPQCVDDKAAANCGGNVDGEGVGSKLKDDEKLACKTSDDSTELKKDVGSKSNEDVKPTDQAEDGDVELMIAEGDEVTRGENCDKSVEHEYTDEEQSQNKGTKKIEVADESKRIEAPVQEKVVIENSDVGESVATDDNALDSSQTEPNLNQSVESDQGPNSSIIVSSEDELNVSTSSSKKGSGTTPKRKKADRAKLREEKMGLKREKEELRRQKQEKKEKMEKIKEEERKKKKDERKKREEERKKKEEVKEEERKKKEEERRKKEETKEEEKKKKEEDRRKKEEVKLAEERKEKLAKMAFTKFFIQPKSKPCGSKKEDGDILTENPDGPKFMPFPVKADMRLAVQVRHSINDENKKVLSDALASSCPPEKLYLDEIKEGLRKPFTGPATWALSEEQHDVIIVESVVEEKSNQEDEAGSRMKTNRQRAKLLQFHDNRRPPYWGTWRKKSTAVTPRKPFGQEKLFDYEVDSDSEWEDEEEGEDIDKEGESDKEQSDDENVGEDGYLLDNTFVPHGYLSDEEAAEEEENLNPEDQKLKLKALKQEFEQELKAKTRLKPRLLGCVWISNDTTEVSKGSLYETLINLRCRWDESEGPIDPSGPAIVDCSPSPSLAIAKFPSTLIEQLVKLVHGSRLSCINLVIEFMNSLDKDKQLSSISKRAVSLKIKEIAFKTPSAMGRAVWTVSPELCAEYNLPSLDPPKVPSPVIPVFEPPLPKPKETALVNFLKKASLPSTPKRRVTPTLVSPIIHGPGKEALVEENNAGISNTPKANSSAPPLDTAKPANNVASSDISKTETPVAPPITIKPGNALKPPDVAKTGLLPSATKTGNAVTPPVRKRIQPITLSKTVGPSTETPSTPKMAPIFRNPMQDTPRPPPTRPRSPCTTVDLCNDSN